MRKRISIAIMIVAAAFLLISVTKHGGASNDPASADRELSQRTQVASVDELVPLTGDAASHSILQFQAGGHVLGFQPNRAYLVALDHALSVEFLGTPGVMPKAVGKAEPKSGNSGAPTLGKVVYPDLWEGVNLAYEPGEGGIAESTYEVAPGADVSKIRLRYNVPVALQGDGSLGFSFERGVLSESAPVAWQQLDGRRVPVEVAFRVSEAEVGFSVGAYDRSHPLIIDPTYAWHTFYGSTQSDFGYGLAVDTGGNVYVTGISNAAWNASGHSPLHADSGGYEFFVLKLNSSGAYQWHTFYGSAGNDVGNALAVDTGGNVYVTGYSAATWDGPAAAAPLHAHSGGAYDIFALKLDTNGGYQWHTFYGSASNDVGRALAVDTGGNVYVTGESGAAWDGPAAAAPLNTHSGSDDLFVLKLNGSGAYQWHTFYGSATGDFGAALAVDTGGNVCVTGYSYPTWDGPAAQAPLHAHSGGMDLLVLKLNSSGAYQWHTFYGSATGDIAAALAVDTGGNVYVTGESDATWDGPAAAAPLHAHSGGGVYDLFVLKLNSSGAYGWHSFYGSGEIDGGSALAVDTSGNLFVTGFSNATWDGPAAAAPLNTHSGDFDLFVLKLNSSGVYQWHTFYGSGETDWGYALAVDTGGNVYVTGKSYSTWGSPLNDLSNIQDIVVLKMTDVIPKSDVLVPGDYDGDGKTDIAVWRPSTGTWYIIRSSDGGWSGTQWGGPTDIPVYGDFDGDGKTDIAVWRPSSGVWYIRPSDAGGYTATTWGTSGDTPVSGDYDGDGKADMAVWRPGSGVWYVLLSGTPGSYITRQWGM